VDGDYGAMPPTAPAERSRPASQGVIMLMSQIGVVNYSTTPDAEVARWAAASEAQMRNDVAPIWHLPAPTLQLVAPGTTVTVDGWVVVVDDAAQRSGLGFHEMYSGRPVGYVLVEYTKRFRQTPSRVFSHEVLEMAIDPTATRTVNINNTLYLIEPGDILAYDAGGYLLNGVLVSGFATPAYYWLEGGARFGFSRNLPGPLPAKDPDSTVLSWYENGTVKFEAAAPTPELAEFAAVHEASRRYRRSLDRAEWIDVPVRTV
jgi:hypothetical protein